MVLAGLRLGWALYGGRNVCRGRAGSFSNGPPPVFGDLFTLLQNKFYVDEFYEWHSHPVQRVAGGVFCDWLDRWLWGGLVFLLSCAVIGLSWAGPGCIDEFVINLGFDGGASRREPAVGGMLSRLQNGQVQTLPAGHRRWRLAGWRCCLMWGCSAS